MKEKKSCENKRRHGVASWRKRDSSSVFGECRGGGRTGVSGALTIRIDCNDALCFLPLFRYLTITVHLLASHSNDPRRLD
jgi:hypothetical protein